MGGVPGPAPPAAAAGLGAACWLLPRPLPLLPLLPDSLSRRPMLSMAAVAPPPLLSLPLLLSAPPRLLPVATEPPSELPRAPIPAPLLLPDDQRLPPPLTTPPAFDPPLSDPAAVPCPEPLPSSESLLLPTDPSEPTELLASPAAVMRSVPAACGHWPCIAKRCSDPSGLNAAGLLWGEISFVYGL